MMAAPQEVSMPLYQLNWKVFHHLKKRKERLGHCSFFFSLSLNEKNVPTLALMAVAAKLYGLGND